MFYLGGVGLALFLAILLLAKQRKSAADWTLAAWLLIIAVHLLMVTIIGADLCTMLWGIDMPLPLFHGPLLYLYTRALTGKSMRWQHWLTHLAVPLLFYLYLIPFLSRPASEKMFVYEHEGVGYESFLFIRGIFIPVSGILYIALSLFALRQHRLKIVEEFSSLDKIDLTWLRNLILWLSVIWVFVLFGNDDWIFSSVVVFIFLIGFFGIRQGVIFSHHAMPPKEEVKEDAIEDDEPVQLNTRTETVKYVKSGLSQATSEALHARLTILMRTEKIYRNSECSLMDLATKLQAPANYVSQVINEREGKNFYDYINGLRIHEFLEIARTPDSRKLTLFAIAQQCGFNSKSSFNRYFKKITGQLPSQFLQQTVQE
ncbi:MAG TPA: helix-turn-helix domain-containing protein [Chryseosolibacter sp.]